MNATLNSKGQITIPLKIRKQLWLQAGDRLDFQLKEGKIVITKITGTLDGFIGAIPKSKRSFTTEKMNRSIDSVA